MPSKTFEEILGLEFDWLATDGHGHVAFFSTAGGGYVPPEFLSDTEAHDRAIGGLLETSASTRARFKPEVKAGLQNTWELVAQRGVFAFDGDPHGGPYILVAAPEQAVHISALPNSVADVARRLHFPSLRFPETHELSTEVLKDE